MGDKLTFRNARIEDAADKWSFVAHEMGLVWRTTDAVKDVTDGVGRL